MDGIMTPEQLQQGRIWLSASAKHRLYHVCGIPRDCWNVNRSDISFQSYKARRTWKSDPDVFSFSATEQLRFFDGLLDTIEGSTATQYSDYAGMTISCTSPAVAGMAQATAAVIVKTLLAHQPNAKVRWLSANQRDRWNRAPTPDWQNAPDVVVITGLVRDPSRELRESVDRLHDWAIRFAPTIIVGTGDDPITLPVTHFNILPNVALYGLGGAAAGRIKTFG
jgi:hypothetical protein